MASHLVIALLAAAAFVLVFSNDFTQATPSLTFSTNITHWTGEPFTAKCEIANFTAGNGSYSVQFMRMIHSVPVEVGSHVVKVHQNKSEHVFEVGQGDDDIEVHSGAHYHLPVFDITVHYKYHPEKQNFWCELLLDDGADSPGHHPAATSNIWANIPVVTFSILQRQHNPFTGRCTIEYYQPEGRHFEVQFQRDGYTFARYISSPNASEEFILYGSYARLGEAITFPTYEVKITRGGSHSEYPYWCQLVDHGLEANRTEPKQTIVSNKSAN